MALDIPKPKDPTTPSLKRMPVGNPQNSGTENNNIESQNRTVEIPREPLEFKRIFGFDPTLVNVLVCTPAYGGLVYTNYMHSVFSMFNTMAHSNIRYGFKTITNESLITRGRNTCVSYFLSHPEFTHLLFIDADISFRPDTIIKLLASDRDVISAVYPKKGIDWNRLPEVVVQKGVVDGKLVKKNLENIQPNLLSYVVNFEPDKEGKLQMQKGCIKVKDAPTGYMLIKRKTFDVLIEKFPDMRYNNDLNLNPEDHKPDSFYLFFDCMVDPKDKRYLSEDYAFCRLVQLAGLESWIEVTSPITHTGTYNFEGDIQSIFEKVD